MQQQQKQWKDYSRLHWFFSFIKIDKPKRVFFACDNNSEPRVVCTFIFQCHPEGFCYWCCCFCICRFALLLLYIVPVYTKTSAPEIWLTLFTIGMLPKTYREPYYKPNFPPTIKRWEVIETLNIYIYMYNIDIHLYYMNVYLHVIHAKWYISSMSSVSLKGIPRWVTIHGI